MAGRDDDPGLPIKLHPCSNGEFMPPPATPLVRETARRARAQAEDNARRLGCRAAASCARRWARRRRSRCSSACANEAAQDASPGSTAGRHLRHPARRHHRAGRGHGGGWAARSSSWTCRRTSSTTNHDVPNLGVGFPQNACGEQDARDCFTVDKYLDLLFNQSDTNMIVISALPFAGSPLDSEVMIKTIDLADRLCGDQRTLMQGEAHPVGRSARRASSTTWPS